MKKPGRRPLPKGTAWAKNNSFLTVIVSVPEKPRKKPDWCNRGDQSKLLLGLRAMGASDTQIVNLLLWIGTGEERYKPGSGLSGEENE